MLRPGRREKMLCGAPSPSPRNLRDGETYFWEFGEVGQPSTTTPICEAGRKPLPCKMALLGSPGISVVSGGLHAGLLVADEHPRLHPGP